MHTSSVVSIDRGTNAETAAFARFVTTSNRIVRGMAHHLVIEHSIVRGHLLANRAVSHDDARRDD